MSRAESGSLAGKLLRIGLVQLVLLTAVFMGVGVLVNGTPPEMRDHDRADHPDDPPDGHSNDHAPPHGPRPHGGPSHGPISPLNTLFVSGLLILGGGSLLTARSIVRPLRHLSNAANALGEGDLRSRSRLDRTDEIGDLSRAFDAMAERIEALVLSEKELLANISHELRTPLARVRVALDIAEESGSAANQGLSEIGADLAEIETLIDDVLTATRLDLARGTSSKKTFDLHEEEIGAEELARRSADRFRSRHASRSLDVSLDAHDVVLLADPVLFRRALDNVIENAHKYSSDSPIALRVFADEARAVFEVRDRGIGIAEEDLAKIFTPFFRSERSRARGTGGVGLGLTLAKRIIEAHGGSIEVESKLDAGTLVRLKLPRRRASGGQPSPCEAGS